MTHLSPDELIDAMEDGSNKATILSPDRQAHLAACEVCRGELAGLSNVLGEAMQTSVPEPSPLYWQHFSSRVRDAVARDAAPGGSWPVWLRLQVLVPLGAVAGIILGLMFALPKQNAVPIEALGVPAAVDSPEALDALAAVVGDFDLDTASAAGVIEPGVAEEAMLHLTAEEQQELTRLLRAELQRAKS